MSQLHAFRGPFRGPSDPICPRAAGRPALVAALRGSVLLTALTLGVALLVGGVAQPREAEARAQKEVTGVLNLNTADEAQLRLLPGVGPTRAKAVLNYRAKKKKFSRPEELRRVKGFGPKTFAKLRKYLTVSGETTLRATRAEAPGPFSSVGGAPGAHPKARR